jgi:hypothetical protein
MITEMITSGQKKQLLRVLEDGLDQQELTKVQADQILKVGNLVQGDIGKSLQKHSIVDKRFGANLLDPKHTFTVPTDYNHDTQVDVFGKKTRSLKSTHYYNDELTSKNFAKVTSKLEPGKTYAIKMFPISETVKSEDCLAFLTSNNATLVGAQGLTALQNDQPEIFPTGKWTVSFDEKDALWKDADGNHWMSRVGRNSDGDWAFFLGFFEVSWDSDFVLVSFCDLDQSSDA